MLNPSSRLFSSPCLISIPKSASGEPDGTIGLYDFLTKEFAYIPLSSIYWIEYFAAEKTWAKTLKDHPTADQDLMLAEVTALMKFGFITTDKDALRQRHEKFKANWSLDLTSALFHFTITDNAYLTQEQSVADQLERLTVSEQPQLSAPNTQPDVVLPSPVSGDCADVVRLMCKRRTNRSSAGHAVSIDELSACLFSGLGITGFVKSTTGLLPLSTTPSGGARNPFEAYVIVNRGQGIEPGAYHYSALQHTLQKVQTNARHELDAYLGKQDWAKDMAACIILVAKLERTAWKYSDPNAYRVVLIEAGHIAQNVMLAATRLGLTVCPTAALAHEEVSRGLGLENFTDIPVYALTLDRPQPSTDVFYANPNLSAFIQPEAASLGPVTAQLPAHSPL